MMSSYQARVIGLLRPLKDVTVTAGESATFDCELSYEGIPVEWFLKGKKLEPSDKVKKLNFIFLHVSSIYSLPLLFSFTLCCTAVPNGKSSINQHFFPQKFQYSEILQVFTIHRETKVTQYQSLQ